MRTRSAVAVVGAALALGLVAGGIVLPHYIGLHSAGPSAIAHTPSKVGRTQSARRSPTAGGTWSPSPGSAPTDELTPSASTSEAPQTGRLGTSLFLRNRDIFQEGFYSSYRRQTGSGEDGSILATCGGEDESVTKHARTAELLHARWKAANDRYGRGSDLMGYEVIGQTTTPAQAAGAVDAAVNLMSGCVVEPATHWYYAKPTTMMTGGTRLTVFITHDGDGKQSGSIAVFVDRRRFGVLELDTYDGTDEQLTKISAAAAHRLG